MSPHGVCKVDVCYHKSVCCPVRWKPSTLSSTWKRLPCDQFRDCSFPIAPDSGHSRSSCSLAHFWQTVAIFVDWNIARWIPIVILHHSDSEFCWSCSFGVQNPKVWHTISGWSWCKPSFQFYLLESPDSKAPPSKGSFQYEAHGRCEYSVRSSMSSTINRHNTVRSASVHWEQHYAPNFHQTLSVLLFFDTLRRKPVKQLNTPCIQTPTVQFARTPHI